MRRAIRIVIGIAARLTLTIVGFFVMFDITFLLTWAVGGFDPFNTEVLWKAPYYLMTFTATNPFYTALMLAPLLLVPFLPSEARSEIVAAGVDFGAYARSFLEPIVADTLLLVSLITAIVLFERRARASAGAIVLFYLAVVPLIWIIWMRLTVLF